MTLPHENPGHNNGDPSSHSSDEADDFNLQSLPTDDDGQDTLQSMWQLGSGVEQRVSFENGHQVVDWRLKGNEDQIARIAGWDKFRHTYENGMGKLYLPEGTRNAASFFSGREALRGERAAIVRFAIQYQRAFKEVTGHIDQRFRWDNIGVTPDHELFVVPPNSVPAHQALSGREWLDETTEELESLLEEDMVNITLPAFFKRSLGDIVGE